MICINLDHGIRVQFWEGRQVLDLLFRSRPCGDVVQALGVVLLKMNVGLWMLLVDGAQPGHAIRYARVRVCTVFGLGRFAIDLKDAGGVASAFRKSRQRLVTARRTPERV